jgi:hypothetical protein
MRRNNRHRTWFGGILAAACICLAIPLLAAHPAGHQGATRPQGPYFGQTPPGTTPAVFAPGIVSTAAHEFACSFTPDGHEFYFTRRVTLQSPTLIMVSRLVDGTWTEPAPASFNDPSARMSFEPQVTPDGRRLYFSSDRPLPGSSPGGPPALNIWYVERQGTTWGPARDPGAPFNPMRAMYVSMTKAGTIYTADISAGMGAESIAVSRPVDGTYRALEKLAAPINAGTANLYPYIAPDESYLIFVRRAPQAGVSSLVVSFRNPDGTWGEPRAVNLGMSGGTPTVSPDGRYLFFSAGERGQSDIYWVSAGVIRAAK